MAEDMVVLVDEQDNQLGIMAKALVHTDKTPLHRGLSVYVFNTKDQVVVQQRALHKRTWPGVWSNSCCGHPLPEETYEAAAMRKVKEELGVEVKDLEKVSDYRYRFERDGIVENEICPVFRCRAVGEVKPGPSEVNDWRWVGWDEWMEILKKDDENKWSPWCKEQVLLLDPPDALK